MKNRNILVGIMFLLYMAGFLSAQNYPSFPIGQYWLFPDARALGMGGAGSVSFNSPGAMLYNPAALAQIDHRLSLDATINLRKLEERRSYPLYDRFDGIIGDGIYAINNNWYLRPQGAVALQIPGIGSKGLTVAVGSFKEIDQNYQYNEEVRQNIFGDFLEAFNKIEFSGALQRYGGAIATSLPSLPNLSLGVQAGILDGSLSYLREINFVDTTQQDVRTSIDRALNNTPLVMSLGAIYRVNERISAGADVSLPYTVRYKAMMENGQQAIEEIGYPLRLNAGFEYRARQELQARLNVDFGYEFWSSQQFTTEIDGAVVTPGQDFSDVIVIKAGIEHIFYNKVPFRVGLQYRNSYENRGRTRTFLTAGTGFFDHDWKVDVAGGVSNMTYSWPDLFSDTLYNGDRSNSNMDDVNESFIFGRVTFSYFLDF
jgi:hypothetical protein